MQITGHNFVVLRAALSLQITRHSLTPGTSYHIHSVVCTYFSVAAAVIVCALLVFREEKVQRITNMTFSYPCVLRAVVGTFQ